MTDKKKKKSADADASQAADSPPKTYLTDEQLEFFKDLLLKKRSAAMEEIREMEERLEDAHDNAAGYTYHMADSGSDAHEREKLTMFIGRQQKYIGYLDRALERIKYKTYGICKHTGEPIPIERLKAVPHTDQTTEAKINAKRRHPKA